ncbi:MAG: cytochrome-c peroxidase [Gammaproteobacteria bacterium]
MKITAAQLLLGYCASILGVFAQASPSPRPVAPLVRLGQILFSDIRFSQDGKVSCGVCHHPDQAFTDAKPVAIGIEGLKGTRNTPSLRNAAYTAAKLWDGRRDGLAAQVLEPFVNPREHGLATRDELVRRFRAAADYAPLFQNAFRRPLAHAAPEDIAQALSAYVTALAPSDTRLSRYLYGRETAALNPAEQRGLELFRGRTHCADCHSIGDQAAPLTDGQYHSLALGFDRLAPQLAALIGKVAKASLEYRERWIGEDPEVAALGRFVITLAPVDIGAFKTPSLYAVTDTAPYMHDGSIPTLDEALDRELYYRGRDLGHPVVLSVTERADLLTFLKTLK